MSFLFVFPCIFLLILQPRLSVECFHPCFCQNLSSQHGHIAMSAVHVPQLFHILITCANSGQKKGSRDAVENHPAHLLCEAFLPVERGSDKFGKGKILQGEMQTRQGDQEFSPRSWNSSGSTKLQNESNWSFENAISLKQNPMEKSKKQTKKHILLQNSRNALYGNVKLDRSQFRIWSMPKTCGSMHGSIDIPSLPQITNH